MKNRKLDDILDAIKIKGLENMTDEQIKGVTQLLDKYTKDAKVTIRLHDLTDIINISELAYYQTLEDVVKEYDLSDEVLEAMQAVGEGMFYMLTEELQKRSETTGVKQTLGRWS